jgi:HK97 family phage major capsid protein
LQAPALVSQAKESGQAANTIQYENIVKMYARAWGSDFIWIGNQEIFPQLATMSLAVGTGGAPVWMPANRAAGMPYQTLMGYPLIFVEQAAALGTVGDLILADMSQYRLVDKGGVQSAMSIHVEFVADEIVFRWLTRVDGQPLWNSALTPYKGSNTRSPFVALATRS